MEEKQLKFSFMEEVEHIMELKRKSLKSYEDQCMDEISHEAAVGFERICGKYKISAEDSKEIYILAQQF